MSRLVDKIIFLPLTIILSIMLDFVETAAALRVLYQHVNHTLIDTDFWPLTEEQYHALPAAEQHTTWFMINPAKLKAKSPTNWMVDEAEKHRLLQAVAFVHKNTNALPAASSLLERLLYLKQILPPILFTPRETEEL